MSNPTLPHTCRTCSAGFGTRRKLQIHQDENHPFDPQCPRCSKRLQNRAALISHLKTHEKSNATIHDIKAAKPSSITETTTSYVSLEQQDKDLAMSDDDDVVMQVEDSDVKGEEDKSRPSSPEIPLPKIAQQIIETKPTGVVEPRMFKLPARTQAKIDQKRKSLGTAGTLTHAPQTSGTISQPAMSTIPLSSTAFSSVLSVAPPQPATETVPSACNHRAKIEELEAQNESLRQILNQERQIRLRISDTSFVLIEELKYAKRKADELSQHLDLVPKKHSRP